VLVLDESRGADRLIGRAKLIGPAQLAGLQVGLERAVLAEYLLLRSLTGSRLSLDDLQLRFDGPVALVQRLRAGELDAIVTYAPHDTALQGDHRFRELFSSAAIPGEVVDVLAVDPVVARQQPDQLRALVRTWWAARDYLRRHPNEALTVMAGRQQIAPEQFKATETRLRYPLAAEQPRLLAASGRIRADAPLPRLSTAFLVDR
jgi:NitT/TauT family transport system substrate-binding protein